MNDARSALIITSTRGFADLRAAARLQEAVAALVAAGWSVDVLAPRADNAFPLHSRRLYTAPRVPFSANLPERPSIRRRLTAALMFLHGVRIASGAGYAVIHGVDDGAAVAHRITKLLPGRHPFVAEMVRPFTVRASRDARGVTGILSRRAERAAIRRAAAVIVADESDLRRFDRPLPRPRVCIVPDPAPNAAGAEFSFSDFDAAIIRAYAYAARRARPRQPA